LLGLSQGASIAIAYAVRHPERVTHLILHGGYARGRLHWSRSASPKEEAEVMIRLAEVGWGQHNPAFRQFFTTQFIPGGSPEQHQWFNDLERISTSPQNAGRFMRIFNEIDVVALLSKVACPTLVFTGQCAGTVRGGTVHCDAYSGCAICPTRDAESPAAGERAGMAPMDG
jgi:pimeloyl-ACP methyl ester carboxylesterase